MPFLDFKGKSAIYSHHLGLPFRMLKTNKTKSIFSPTDKEKRGSNLDDNLIIHGDNLHALKALLPRYSGKIKCIYIDPPYNTGNEGWKYNDKVNSPVIKEWLKQNRISTDDLERHDKWLCMMWPRLQLLKELLADNGVIFVSIDDNEQHRLRMIMDEIFGEENFVQNLVWQRASGGGNAGNIVTGHEHVLIYNKREKAKFYGKKSTRGKIIKYKGQNVRVDDDIIRKVFGRYTPGTERRCYYEELHLYKNPRQIKEIEKKIKNKELILLPQKNKKHLIAKIVKEGERKILYSIIQNIFNKDGTAEMQSLGLMFDNPKPKELIKILIHSSSDKNAVVLDSFAGSGTTAHAVLELNKEDGGHRKFILVECEDYASTITAERVRRLIKGIPKSKDEKLKKGLGGSFTYFELGEEINITNLLKGKALPGYKQLAEYVFYTATGKSLNKTAKANPPWFIGESQAYRVHLVYKPDLNFLKSKESALHEDLASHIRQFNQNSGKTSLVFAPAKYITQKKLIKDYGIHFCQLPYDIHKITEPELELKNYQKEF